MRSRKCAFSDIVGEKARWKIVTEMVLDSWVIRFTKRRYSGFNDISKFDNTAAKIRLFTVQYKIW